MNEINTFMFKPQNPEITPKRVGVVLVRFNALLERRGLDLKDFADLSQVDNYTMLEVPQMTEEECAKMLNDILNQIERDMSSVDNQLLTHMPLRAVLRRAQDIMEANSD